MKCILCGGELCWDNDYDANDYYDLCEEDEGGYDKGAIVSMYHCMQCGREYVISDPTKEEMEATYSEFWNKKS